MSESKKQVEVINCKTGDPVYNTKNAYLLFNLFHHDKALNGFNTVVDVTDTHFTCDKSINLQEFQSLSNYYAVMHQENRLNLSGENAVLHIIHDRDKIICLLDEKFKEESIKQDEQCQDRIKLLKEKIADAQKEIDNLNKNGLIFKGVSIKERLQSMHDIFIAKMNTHLLKHKAS
jgi:hypothetical protein